MIDWGDAPPDPKAYIHSLGGGIILHECPISFITPESEALLQLFWDCHSQLPTGYGCGILRHSLPRSGGLFDQDKQTMEAFKVIEAEALDMLNQPPKKKPNGKKP